MASNKDSIEETIPIADPNELTIVTFDDVLKKVGEFGRFQVVLYIMFSLPYLETAMQLIGWVFVGATPQHQCFDNGTVEYDHTHINSSVVLDWDLVCQNSSLHATVGAAPMVGYLGGGIFFGTLSDKIGRKPTFLWANLLLLISGMCTALSPNFWCFVLSRFFVGLSIAGCEASCFVMSLELVGPSKRTLAGILCWFFETGGLMLSVAIAYGVRNDWRWLQVLYTLPALAFYIYAWAPPDSIRWLLSKNKTMEAEKVIRTLAKWNGVKDVPEELIVSLLQQHNNTDQVQETYTVLTLFKYFNLRIKTLVLALTWTVCSALYYVLLLDQSELSDDPYLGFLITASVQLPGYIYVIFTLERPFFGRKRSMCAFLLLSGLCLCLHPLMKSRLHKVILSVLGRFCANCSYTILNLFSAEQFPTVVRGVGVGFTLVISRIGTILAPYILLLGPHAPIFFGIAALTAGISSMILPETLGQPLPETIADGEARGLAKLR